MQEGERRSTAMIEVSHDYLGEKKYEPPLHPYQALIIVTNITGGHTW